MCYNLEKSPCYVEIDVGRYEKNCRALKRFIGNKRLGAVVKCNAYGHGAVEIARAGERGGVDFFAVATLGEGMELREAGITLPILVLGYTDPSLGGELVKCELSQAVFSLEYAERLRKSVERTGKKLKVHIKLDTGMRRLGFRADSEQGLAQACKACGYGEFSVEGVFSHLSCAGDEGGERFTALQQEGFLRAINYLKDSGIAPEYVHLSASAGALFYPFSGENAVRIGLALYGVSPLKNPPVELLEVLSFKARIAQVKTCRAGDRIGYGGTYEVLEGGRYATIPVGYGEGLPRSASGVLPVTVNGGIARVVGRICMDQAVVRLGNITASEGDVVTVLGRGGISAGNLAEISSTIPYEIFTRISARIPRVVVNSCDLEK